MLGWVWAANYCWDSANILYRAWLVVDTLGLVVIGGEVIGGEVIGGEAGSWA